MNHLCIKSLSLTYPNGKQALKDINLDIYNGMFGLLGANGAGKSSLMKSVASLQPPSTGNIFFNGTNIYENPEIIKNALGYLPQSFGVYPGFSAVQLLDHLAILKGVLDRRERKKQIEALLEQTNLAAHQKQAVHTYSGGMKQRFGIAQALLGDPQIIIVDEPTAGLDPEERYRFLNLLSEIGENVIIILSTHIVEDIEELCTRMALIKEGKIIVVDNPKNLIDQMDGNIWMKTIQKNELDTYRNSYRVISSRLFAGQTQIKIYSEVKSPAGFKPASPDLEDYFFYKNAKQGKHEKI